MSRYGALAIEALYDFVSTRFTPELRAVETSSANLTANQLRSPSRYYIGLHPRTPDPVCMLVYIRPGMDIYPAQAGQRLQKMIVPCAVELRFRPGAQNANITAYDGPPGAFTQNDYWLLLHYSTAMIQMFEPRSSDASFSLRPTLDGQVNVARMVGCSIEPETQSFEEDEDVPFGVTTKLDVSVLNPYEV